MYTSRMIPPNFGKAGIQLRVHGGKPSRSFRSTRRMLLPAFNEPLTSTWKGEYGPNSPNLRPFNQITLEQATPAKCRIAGAVVCDASTENERSSVAAPTGRYVEGTRISCSPRP